MVPACVVFICCSGSVVLNVTLQRKVDATYFSKLPQKNGCSCVLIQFHGGSFFVGGGARNGFKTGLFLPRNGWRVEVV